MFFGAHLAGLRRAAVVVLLAAVAAALVACGDDSDANDYRTDVRDVQERYFADLERFATEATETIAVDEQAAVRALQQYAATATKLADELDAVEAPAEQRQVGERLVAAYRSLGASADALRTALGAGDVQTADRARQDFNRGQAQLVEAIAELNAAD